MKRTIVTAAALALIALATGPSPAGAVGVEVWTDKGNDAVYEPGDRMQIKVRASDDSHLLVYEIDSEGYVRVLFPYKGGDVMVEGHRTYRVPSDDSDLDLVVQEPVGEGYIVALISGEAFKTMPWYLRPYDAQAEANGFLGAPTPEEEEGVTAEGKIVGDPFVAMERIRRRVLVNADDARGFATDYTTYYVHEQVRYPRYLCYDCHRQNQYAFWDGFDPYYTNCSVFDFRVNWSWCWGPSYWFGQVPYYCYVYRPDCPPRWHNGSGVWYSSWDGAGRWNDLWGGGGLHRYKSAPPVTYVPPAKYRTAERLGPGQPMPPGFIAHDGLRSPGRIARPVLPLGRGGRDEVGTREGGGSAAPAREGLARRWGLSRPSAERAPAERAPAERQGHGGSSGGRDPEARQQPRDERPAPSYTPPREPASGSKGNNSPPAKSEGHGRVERPSSPPPGRSSPPPQQKSPPPSGGRGEASGGKGKITR